MKVWAIANQKGGVGKTTTAITLAGLLTDSGHNVMLMDLDPHGSATSYLGFDPETIESSVYKLFKQTAAGQQPDPLGVVQPTRVDRLQLRDHGDL